MHATGLFFLRAAAEIRVDQVTREPVGIVLPVVEREKNPQGQWVSVNTLVAKWKGPQALQFFASNRAELRAGRPVHLELDRLSAHDGEVHGNVTRLELAPLAPSWQKGETDQQPRAAVPASI